MDWIAEALRSSDCKRSPVACLKQVARDGAIFVLIFSVLSLSIDNKYPEINSLAEFMVLYVPVVFFLRAMDMEYAEQFGRVAGWLLAQKMFGVMTVV